VQPLHGRSVSDFDIFLDKFNARPQFRVTGICISAGCILLYFLLPMCEDVIIVLFALFAQFLQGINDVRYRMKLLIAKYVIERMAQESILIYFCVAF
jgi:hypothetical protein